MRWLKRHATDRPDHDSAARACRLCPKHRNALLDDSAFDIEGWLAGRIADKFCPRRSSAFINGDGVDKPKGLLAHTSVDNDVWAWGNLGYVPTGVDGDVTADAIIDLVYALGRSIAPTHFCHEFQNGGPCAQTQGRRWPLLVVAMVWPPVNLLVLMGYPVLIAEDMPDAVRTPMPLPLATLRAGYTVAERPDLRVLRDPVQRQTARPVLRHQARRRRRKRFCCDQAAEIRYVLMG